MTWGRGYLPTVYVPYGLRSSSAILRLRSSSRRSASRPAHEAEADAQRRGVLQELPDVVSLLRPFPQRNLVAALGAVTQL